MLKKSCLIIFSICIWLWPLLLKGQQSFSLLPEINSNSGQSKIRAVAFDSDYIYTMGELLDTGKSNALDIIKPYVGKFDYSGDVIFQTKIENDTFSGQTGIYGNLLKRINEDKMIYYGSFYDTNDITKGIVFLINPLNGQLLNFKIIEHENKNLPIYPISITNSLLDSSILLLNQTEINATTRVLIRKIDFNLNDIDEIVVNTGQRDNYAFYIEPLENNAYSLIGSSWRKNDLSDFPDIKPYKMIIDSVGQVLEFKILDQIADKTVYFLPKLNTIEKTQDGYIFSCLAHYPNNICPSCYYTKPVTYMVSDDFKTIYWVKHTGDGFLNDTQRNVIIRSIWNSAHKYYLLTGYEDYKHYKGSYITKLSDTGESIWTRYFVPVDWEGEDIAWSILNDIEIAEDNSIIGAGMGILFTEEKWKSWIVYLDSMGCIIPGCDLTQTEIYTDPPLIQMFSVFPNPTNDFLILICNQCIDEEFEISVTTQQGIILKSAKFRIFDEGQFILNTAFLTPQQYYLVVKNNFGKVVSVIPFQKI